MIETILYNDWSVRIIRSRRKTLSLEIDDQGLKARAPMNMREQTIIKFIRHKEMWIERHLANLKPKPPQIALVNGALLPFRNQQFQLMIEPNSRSKVRIKLDQLILPLMQSQLEKPDAAKAKLVRWYKQQALKNLRIKVAELSAQMNIRWRGSIKVREYSRRWGSCSHSGDLSFNWRIILAPDAVCEYVVVHELAHLVEFNHSRKFWNIVNSQMPDWRMHQQWLADHGAKLYTI